MTDPSQWGLIIAAAGTGLIFAVLAYFNRRQGRDMLAAILAAAAILFAVLCVGLVILR